MRMTHSTTTSSEGDVEVEDEEPEEDLDKRFDTALNQRNKSLAVPSPPSVDAAVAHTELVTRSIACRAPPYGATLVFITATRELAEEGDPVAHLALNRQFSWDRRPPASTPAPSAAPVTTRFYSVFVVLVRGEDNTLVGTP